MTGGGGGGAGTHLHDLPEVILINIFALVGDVRSRNAMSLVSRRWYYLERSTRTSLALRGNVRDLFLLPACFLSVTNLDLSLLSPWGHPFLHDPPPPAGGGGGGGATDHLLLARRLRQAFPNLTSLTVYARTPATLEALAPQWPMLRHAALVRWHQRPDHPLGSDLDSLLASCPSLSSLDLSRFYCWAADLPPALHAHPAAAASLSRLDLLNAAASDGFRSSELVSVAHACPNLRHLLVPCVFNPRYLDFVGDAALLAVASACPRLTTLHIADPAALSPSRGGGDFFGAAVAVAEDAGITRQGMEALFAALPLLEDLTFDLCHKVPNAGPALEALSYKCPRIRSLKLGCFQGICIAAGLHLDGVAVCGGLESLCIKNCPDLSDASLVAIARGCRRISKLEIQRCDLVSDMGIKKLAGMLRSTLVDVSISDCRGLDANLSLQSLEPIRDRIERLHIDCEWIRPENKQLPESLERDMGIDELEEQEMELKKCRYSDHLEMSHLNNGCGSSSFWFRTWDRLRFLSLWVPVGEVLTPLTEAGLQVCPVLEEISIKVEGDCRNFGRPTQLFGLSYLTSYPLLTKMKLDCSEAIGYALTAPTGQMDLSTWERFYLRGIGDLDLQELDYWPPQDRDVNQRSVSLPATSLIQGCSKLRKLFIHGTMHEHFLRFFLMMHSLRDVQLREDYYPAPENDMSTEMRVGSCSRFEDALNSRLIPP